MLNILRIKIESKKTAFISSRICNIIHVFTVTYDQFNTYMLKKSFYIPKSKSDLFLG